METIDEFFIRIPVDPTFEPSMRGGHMVYNPPQKFKIQIIEKKVGGEEGKEAKALFVLDTEHPSPEGVTPVFQELSQYQGRIVMNNYNPGFCEEASNELFPADMFKGIEGLCVDLGCNEGRFLRNNLAKTVGKNSRFLGLDYDGKAIEKAVSQTSDPRFSYRQADMRQSGVEPGSASVVSANFSLSHIPWPLEAIKEIGRITKPGGLVFVSDTYFNPEDYARWFQSAGFMNIEYEKSDDNRSDRYLQNFKLTARKR